MEEKSLSRGTEAGKPSCEAPGGLGEIREKGNEANNVVVHGGKDAILTMVRFGKLAKSRAIDGCTPAPFLRWYNVSRGT